ncbi:MAG: hypothetical protein OWR62_11755 [Sulfobacillus thermotolerans]|nr:hypothetical protein [Sulfobacillus thermotolerans]
MAQASPPPLVLLDLSIWDQRLSPCLEAVQHIAGFGPHVAREQFQAARAQGIETLWANSALSQKLGPWIVTNR